MRERVHWPGGTPYRVMIPTEPRVDARPRQTKIVADRIAGVNTAETVGNLYGGSH